MAGTISSLIRGILAKSALFASKQRLLFECAALFEGVNIIRMGVNIVRIYSEVRIMTEKNNDKAVRSGIRNGFNRLRSAGLVSDGTKIERCHTRITRVDSSNRNDILQKAERYENERRQKENGGSAEGRNGRAGVRNREQAGLLDYIRLAVRKEKGENIRTDVEKLFGMVSDVLNSRRRKVSNNESLKEKIEDIAYLISIEGQGERMLKILSQGSGKGIITQIKDEIKDLC